MLPMATLVVLSPMVRQVIMVVALPVSVLLRVVVLLQVVVPLLIETNMHPLFHNILMVYAPEEEQKRRLIERDGLTAEMAMKMIRSQLSAEEKEAYCDLVIDNSGSLEDTRREVEELWGKLKQLQQDRKAYSESG